MIKNLNSEFLVLDEEYFCYNKKLKVFTYISDGETSFENE